MNYDADYGVVTRPGRDNFFSLESDINQIYKNIPLTDLLDSIPSGVILLNRFRQVLFCNAKVRGMFPDQKINLGLRPGELLGCAFSHDSPFGCGEGPKCQVCDAVKVVKESMKTNKQVVNEATIYLNRENPDKTFEFLVAASPYKTGGMQLTLVSIEDISRIKKHYKLESYFYNSMLENTSTLEESLDNLHKKPVSESKSDVLFRSRRMVHEIISELLNQKILFNAVEKKLPVKTDDIKSTDILSNCKTHFFATNLVIDPNSEDFELKTDFFLLNRALFVLLNYILQRTGKDSILNLGIKQQKSAAIIQLNTKVNIVEDARKSFDQPLTVLHKTNTVEPFTVKLLIEEYLDGTVRIEDSDTNGTSFNIEIAKDLTN